MNIQALKGYEDFLHELKSRIRTAQTRAALSVNRELVLLYWHIGRDILTRQKDEGWGAKVIERLANDLRKEFPDMKGFSPRNLLFMRSFADEFMEEEKVKQLVSQLPWGHVVRLIQKVKPTEEREWYIHKTLEHGWSRDILVMQIETSLFHRQGKAITNFAATLPRPQSDLAQQTLNLKTAVV